MKCVGALDLYVYVETCNFEAFMFLSMYLMYRFARSGRSWSYLFDVGLFVVLISLISTVFPVTMFVLFTFPVSFLSFPFYFWVGELQAPAALRDTYPWLYYRSVRFLTVDLNLTPDWQLSGAQLVSHGELYYNNAFVVAFSMLLLANVLGGVIGYLVGRRYQLRVWSEERWVVVGVVSAVLAFVSGIVVGTLFPWVNWSLVEPVLTVVLGFGVIVVGAVMLSFLVDYVKKARVATLMVLSGLIFFLTGQYFSQLLMTIVGSALVVFGGIIYFVKLVISHVRAREPYASLEVSVER